MMDQPNMATKADIAKLEAAIANAVLTMTVRIGITAALLFSALMAFGKH
jgi:hypothetical protein